MRTEFQIDYDSGESGLANGIFQSLVGMVVSLKLRADSGYPTQVYIMRVDDDGDVVVCELDDNHMPIENANWAIPQEEIFRVRVGTGSFA